MSIEEPLLAGQFATHRRGGPMGFIGKSLRVIRRKPVGAVAALIICILVLLALAAPLVTAHGPNERVLGARLLPVGSQARDGTWLILGGDEIGRDLFSRIVYGARTSLLIGVGAVAVGTVVGALLGMLSGYFVGLFDLFLQRVMDTMNSIPGILLALLFMSVLAPNVITIAVVVGIITIPSTNRVVRAATLGVRSTDYVLAARAIGASEGSILFRHVLPNITAPIVVIGTALLGQAILIEASLSYLGYGVQPPEPSWGGMISQAGRTYILRDPRLLIVPAVAVSVVVFAFNLFGDAVRDLLDPKLRRG
jgi:peptide/nickel transport system permease protein